MVVGFLLVLAGLVLWISRDILPWLIISAILAYLLNPLVDLFARFKLPRGVTTLILFAIVLLLVVILPVLLAPVLIRQLSELAAFDVGRTATTFFNWLTRSINELPDQLVVFGFALPTGNVVDQIQIGLHQVVFVPTLAEVLGYIQQGLTAATGIVTSTAALSVAVVGRLVSGLITAILIFFLSMYMTRDWPKIRAYIADLFPPSYQSELSEVSARIGAIWASFFRGQLLLSAAVGTVTWFALTLIGMPGALVLALVAGLLEVIPTIGPIIATIPAVIVALLQGSDVLSAYGVGNVAFALITVGVYFIIQQLEGTFLVPRIIGSSVNLHPVVVICGVAVGYSTFGILGAFLASPVLASTRVVGGFVHAKLLDYPPFQGKSRSASSARPVYRLRVTGDQLASEDLPPSPVVGEVAAQLQGDSLQTFDASADRTSASMAPADTGARVSSSTAQ
jgi:predicted PurR-regulated permease PerM